MKRLFRGLAHCFLSVSSLFAAALPAEAIVFDVTDVPGVVGRRITVDVEERLITGPIHYRGGDYSPPEWFALWATLAINVLLPHPNTGEIRRIAFRAEAPPETGYTFMLHEP
ncbi:MAG: hypothetical protein Q4D57_04525 [Clostridia bacterium]|nr:hypothetical protein [Clostridia bacterium]